MAVRRLLYLAVLEGCLIFYIAYREWFSWLALVSVACLPWFSLLLSLPAMLTVKYRLQCPEQVQIGTPVTPQLVSSCRLPMPPVRYRLRLVHSITAAVSTCKPGKHILTEHCGTVVIQPRLWVYDYLGLLRLPKNSGSCRLTVLPHLVAAEAPPSLMRYTASALQPKPGGGFAENHDLRLYRPGDDLRQIHWKLASKTGKLIFREPMIPRQSRMLLTMALRGTPQLLDDKFGRLLWMSRYLLENGLSHEIRCLTGKGLEVFQVQDEASLTEALCSLLGSPAAAQQTIPESVDGVWQYHIGGGEDEG